MIVKNEYIANNLLDLRKSRAMTQVEVAKKLGISKRTLCSYEKSERRLPSALIEPLTRILDATANEILGIDFQKIDGRGSDTKLKRKLNTVPSLPSEDRKMVSQLIDHLLSKNKITVSR